MKHITYDMLYGRRLPPPFSAYSATSSGRIYSWKTGKPREKKTHVVRPKGYAHTRVGMNDDTGKFRNMLVHRAVLLAFAGPPAAGMVARHIDGDATNNHISNLAWGTSKENRADAYRHGTAVEPRRGPPWTHPGAKLTEAQMRAVFAARAAGLAVASIAAEFNVSAGIVYYTAKRMKEYVQQ